MKTVVVGMSGGVDSSVAALLLKQQGYKVIGLHMINENSVQEVEDAKSVKDLCEKLGLEYKIVNYKDEMQQVKDYFIEEYKNGRTPNPCVMCNHKVKFKPFIDYANSICADFFATGHYAKIEHINGKNILKKASDQDKDQTYFLNQLTSSQLEKALFPLGELTKPQVRKIAEENNLISAHKKDSFDVCFVGSKKFKEYMDSIYKDKPGKIVDINTKKIVGTHNGISKYTIGQRKGLGIGGIKNGVGRWFVVKKDLDDNILFVSQGNEEVLLSNGLVSYKVNWILGKPSKSKFSCSAKFRYRQLDQEVTVEVKKDDKAIVYFKEKQRAIAIGQFVVFYDGDICLGGGAIEEIF